MNIVRKDLDSTNAIITLSIVKADYAEKVEKKLRDYRKKANIPGFRPGNVPLGLVQKMYGKAVLAEEINTLVSDGLYDYIKENNIETLGDPLPNETEQKELDFNTQEDFEFVFDIAIAPEFEVELTKKDKIKYYNIEISDEMIDNQIKSYTGRFGKYIQTDVAEPKDMLKGMLVEMKDDGIMVEDAVMTPEYVKDEAQKALFDKVKKDDIVTFNPRVAFDNDAEISSLLKLSKEEAKDITSDFQFTIQSITRYTEAEIDQELFDKVYGEGVVTSEEAFRAKVKENIQENLIADSNYKFGIDARQALVEKYNNLVFPDAFLKRWLLTKDEKMTGEQIETDFPLMLNDLRWELIKSKITKKGEIKIEYPDIEEQAKKFAKAQFAQYGMVGLGDEIYDNYAQDMLKKEDMVRRVYDSALEERVMAYIKDAVKLDEKSVSMDEFNKMFETK